MIKNVKKCHCNGKEEVDFSSMTFGMGNLINRYKKQLSELFFQSKNWLRLFLN
jgi:hypothetical protein